MKFAELHVGQSLRFGTHIVTEDEIVEFGRRYDPQHFHIDRAAAEASRWQGLIASGFHTCGLAMRMMVDHVLADSESIGSPGLEYLKWPSPVRAGDRLHMQLHVLDRSVSSSGGTGIVRWRWLMLNQEERPVLDLVATSLFAVSGG